MQLMKNALILFAHGSRNLAWRAPFERIATEVTAQTDARVELAFLELMSPTLPEVFERLAQEGVSHISIVPLFFGLGNHVSRDLQELIAMFIDAHPQIQIQVAPPLGESDAVLQVMADYALAQLRAI